MGIKNKKLAEGDLVIAKAGHWATKRYDSKISRDSIGIITTMNDEGIAVYWFKQCIQGEIKPYGTRGTQLKRVSRPKR